MDDTNKAPVENKPEETPNPMFEKLLKEKKNAMAALDEYKRKTSELEMKIQELETTTLEKENNYKELYTRREKEYSELKSRLEATEKEKVEGVKRSELAKELEKMGIRKERVEFALKYLSKDLDKLKYDPDHRVVLGVEEVAKNFKEELPETFGTHSTMPDSTAPNFHSTNFRTVEEFMSLPAKDRNNPENIKRLYESQGIAVRP